MSVLLLTYWLFVANGFNDQVSASSVASSVVFTENLDQPTTYTIQPLI